MKNSLLKCPECNRGYMVAMASGDQVCNGCGFKQLRKRKHTVGIRKEYFPAELRPSTEKMTAYFEVIRVFAENRVQAATKVWVQNGKRWLNLMNPDSTINGNRIISLEVDDPLRRIPMGRITAVKVYEGVGR